MGRKNKKNEAELSEKAKEIRGKAKVMADEGGEAFKEFTQTTRGAAKDFANSAFKAAKDLLETVEDAGERYEKETQPKKRRGRKVLKAAAVIGIGAAIVANESARNFISEKLGMGGGEPEPWESASFGDGESTRSPVSQTTP